jgi:hypothetical protein
LLAGLFSLIWGLFQILYAVLEVITAFSWIADIFVWAKSKSSRTARKEAKSRGEHLPQRSSSHIAYIVLTVSSLTLTTLLVLKWWGKI